jgi:oxalate---CoA ligase
VVNPGTEKPERVVALAMTNAAEFPLGFLGIAWAGAATAPLNPEYKQEEFAFYLEVMVVSDYASPEGSNKRPNP